MTIFNPKFLVKNMIDAVAHLGDSAGTSDQFKRFLFDRNTDFQWESIGETSGTRTITWTPGSSQTVTRIFLQNINWKDFTIKYNTSNDFTPTINVTGNSDANVYIEVDSQAVNDIVFSITDTFTASVTAKCGQIYVGTEIFEINTASGGKLNRARAEAPYRFLMRSKFPATSFSAASQDTSSNVWLPRESVLIMGRFNRSGSYKSPIPPAPLGQRRPPESGSRGFPLILVTRPFFT